MIAGKATIRIDGFDRGDVEYKILVMRSAAEGERAQAAGHIWGGTDILDQAIAAEEVYLRRHDVDHTMQIVVTTYSPGEGAEISVLDDPGPYGKSGT